MLIGECVDRLVRCFLLCTKRFLLIAYQKATQVRSFALEQTCIEKVAGKPKGKPTESTRLQQRGKVKEGSLKAMRM